MSHPPLPVAPVLGDLSFYPCHVVAYSLCFYANYFMPFSLSSQLMPTLGLILTHRVHY